MFGIFSGFGRYSPDKGTRTRRPRSFRAAIEVVEDRTLLSTLSAISWTSGGVQHSAVFGIGADDSVIMNKDATGWASLGSYARQVSAGLDALGRPEVYS